MISALIVVALVVSLNFALWGTLGRHEVLMKTSPPPIPNRESPTPASGETEATSTFRKDLRHFAKVWCFAFVTATAGLLVVYVA